MEERHKPADTSLAGLIASTTLALKNRKAFTAGVQPPEEPPVNCGALLALIEAAQQLYVEECPGP